MKKRNTEAVSEIIGEVTLLAIAVVTISIIYTQVLSTPGPADTTNVAIIGRIEEGHPAFELQRGESLGPDTKIVLTLAGFEQRVFLQGDIGDQSWDIGERIVLPVEDITGIQVEGMIVETTTNEIVFRAVLQEGLTFRYKGGIWHFDEPWWNGTYDEVKDSSENDNHGRALNGAKIIQKTQQPKNIICNNSGYFSGFLHTVKVNTSWTLCITNQITIDAWMKPQVPEFITDIVDVSGTFGYTPYIVPIVGDIYAYIAEDTHKICRLCTVEINTEGSITNRSNIILGTSTAGNICQPKIVQMTEKTSLVSFIDFNYKVNLITVNISTNGSIEYINKLIFAEESDRNDRNSVSLQKITENLCAIAYWTPSNGGLLKTVKVSTAGKIIDTGKMIQYDNVYTKSTSREPHLVHVAGDIFALAYRGPSEHCFLKTFTITPAGDITYTGNSVEFETSGYEPYLIQVSGDVFAVAYRNSASFGIVKTFIISSDGSIAWTGHMMVFEGTVGCFNPCVVHAEDDMYIIAYTTGSSGSTKGYVITLRLGQNGLITPIDGSRKQFRLPGNNGETSYYPIIINIAEDLYAISYTGAIAHPGYLITILIGPHGRGIYKEGSYLLYANTTMVEGIINTVRVSYYNNSLGLGWHHFALTYDGISIRLYVNGVIVNETSYPYHRIAATNAPLYFGRFYCGFIDEIAIYGDALTQEQILDHFMHPGLF